MHFRPGQRWNGPNALVRHVRPVIFHVWALGVASAIAAAPGRLEDARPQTVSQESSEAGAEQPDGERPKAPESVPARSELAAADEPPPKTRRNLPVQDRKAKAAQDYYTLLSLLAALGIVLLAVLLLSRVLQSWRRRMLDERRRSGRTAYVDAWANARVTEDQIRAATEEESMPGEPPTEQP